MKITDLYFGIKRYDLSTRRLATTNLFNCRDVLLGVALYKLGKGGESCNRNSFEFIFSGTRGAVEYEFYVSDPMLNGDKEYKLESVYSMYAEPNKRYLMELINSVSKASCARWLKEWKEQHGRG